MKALTHSQAHYIKAIYELSCDSGQGARVLDIADKLELSKASVSLAVDRLEKDELVYRDQRRRIHLTPEGERHAVSMLDKCAVIRSFLTGVLGVDDETAVEDACAMEHAVSTDTLCALCRLSRKVNTNYLCPENCHISEKRGGK